MVAIQMVWLNSLLKKALIMCCEKFCKLQLTEMEYTFTKPNNTYNIHFNNQTILLTKITAALRSGNEVMIFNWFIPLLFCQTIQNYENNARKSKLQDPLKTFICENRL